MLTLIESRVIDFLHDLAAIFNAVEPVIENVIQCTAAVREAAELAG